MTTDDDAELNQAIEDYAKASERYSAVNAMRISMPKVGARDYNIPLEIRDLYLDLLEVLDAAVRKAYEEMSVAHRAWNKAIKVKP